MRNTMWVILTLLLGAIVAPCVRADTVTFTCTANCAAPAPTAPDVTFASPTLDITFDGQSLSLTLPSQDVDTDTYTWFTSNNLFIIADTDQSFDLGANVADISGGEDGYTVVEDEGGTLTFTSPTASTPEPGTVTLMMVGIGLVLVMRKRIGLCHSQGT